MTVPPVPAPPPPAPVKHRPGTVVAAAVLMFVLALLSLVWAGLTFVAMSVITDEQLREQMQAQQQGLSSEQTDQMLAVVKAFTYGIGALLALLGLAAVALGVLVYRGNRVGRILSFVLTGFFALCCGLGGLTGAVIGSGGAQGVLGALLPVLILGFAIAVIVLLAMPGSNRYFSKPEPQWQVVSPYGMPVPGGQPPAAPAAPPVPGGGDEPVQIGLGEPPARPWSPPPSAPPAPAEPPAAPPATAPPATAPPATAPPATAQPPAAPPAAGEPGSAPREPGTPPEQEPGHEPR